MSHTAKKVRMLPFLHLLATLGIAVWWGAYLERRHGSRSFRLSEPAGDLAAGVPILVLLGLPSGVGGHPVAAGNPGRPGLET